MAQVEEIAESLRQTAETLTVLRRKVAWGAQDALESGAALPRPDQDVEPERLALEFAARSLAPPVLDREYLAVQAVADQINVLRGLVLPLEATAIQVEWGW